MSLSDKYQKQLRKLAREKEELRLAKLREQKRAELEAMTDEHRDAYYQKQSKMFNTVAPYIGFFN